jgi:restriction system protein
MAVPDFQGMMRPALEVLNAKGSASIGELREELKERFDVTPEELQELIPGGRQSLFVNRVTWATVHLVNAGLLERPRRGFFEITESGREYLRKHEGPLRTSDLKKIPQYRKSWEAARGKISKEVARVKRPTGRVKGELTPEETIGLAYAELRDSLASELIDQILKASPSFFEDLVIHLLVAMGYGGSFDDAARTLGRVGDGGVDGMIKQDVLGLDRVYVQAKRWKDKVVGRPDIQAFVGSLEGRRAARGVFITTSKFSDDAINYVDSISKRVILIDGEALAQYMIDYKIGVRVALTYEIPAIDSDYFDSGE